MINNGWSRHMIENMSYLTDYDEINRGFVAFRGNPKGGKITRKGTIRTGKLDFENVYFVRELKFNLFSVSQMCDKKNSVLFNDTECIVLSLKFKLVDESQVFLSVPKKKNMYSVDLKNIVPKGGTKDETSGILNTFLTRIENLVDHKVKVIRCDNATEFKNKEMNQFCEMKGILRQYSVARTLQQNGVAKRRNMTLIEAARTMLADSKLPTTFWAEAVNIACYDDGFKPLSDDGKKIDEDLSKGSECKDHEKQDNVNNANNVNTVSSTVNAAGINELPFYPDMPALEDIGLFDFSNKDEDDGEMADINNLETTIQASPTPATRIHKDHPLDQVIGDLHSATQTRNMSKNLEEHGFAMKEELLQFKLQEVWTLVDLPNEKRATGTKWVFGNKKDERGIVELCNAFEKLMHEKFQISSMGELTIFLGLQVKQKNDGIFISQDKYVAEILKKFRFTKFKNASTPMETQKPLLKDEYEEEVDVHIYRYQVNPKVSHLHVVKKIFRYFKGKAKKNVRLMMDKLFEMEIELILLLKVNADRHNLLLLGSMLMLLRFWSTAMTKTINEESQIHARVDGKEIIITKSSVRRDLQLADEDGVDCLPNSIIFENLELMGTMASAIICLAINQTFNFSKLIFDMGEGSALPTVSQHTPTILESSSSQLQKTQKHMKPKRKNTQVPQPSSSTKNVTDEAVHKERGDRLVMVAITASSLEAEQDSGNIDKTQSKTTPNEASSPRTTSGGGLRSQEAKKPWGIQLFKLGEEVFVDKDDDVKEVNAASELNVASIATTDSAAVIITTKEVTLAKALAELKASKPKVKGVFIQEPSETTTTKIISLKKSQDKEFEEEQRLAREKAQKELEANIALIETWDDVQAKFDADYQLVERLQAEEQQELTDEENAKLFMKLLEKRRKKLKDLKNKSFDFIQKMFDKAFNRVNTFVDFRIELVEGSSKRVGEEVTQERSKKQKGRIVGIKSHLNVVGIITAHIDVNTSLIKLVLLVNFKKNILSSYYYQYKEVTTAQVEKEWIRILGRNFVGLRRDMHVFVGNMSYIMDFTILESIETNIDPSLSNVVFGRPFVEIAYQAINRKYKLMTFTDGIKEITFKTPYKDPERSEFSSEGHDLLSSRVLLSERDYDIRCRKPSDLEDMFYKDTIKLRPEYLDGVDDEGEVT
nr:putative ribonuclease H-like domain-containing protein [Tanacetum cinerariifolium]